MPSKGFSGFRYTIGSLILIIRVIREPGRYLSEPILSETQSAGILALVWRILILAKLIELLPWTGRAWETTILVLIFLGATPLALAVLRAFAVPVDGWVRLLGGGNDRDAAKRAVALSAVFPNPLICLYLLSPLLNRHFGPVIATFALYGICGVMGTVLTWIAIAKAYRLPFGRSVILVAIPSASTLLLVFQVPFYISDRYSPSVVKGDVEPGVLDLRRFPLDSAVDGSGFMQRDLLDYTDLDSVELDSAYRRRTVPDSAMGRKLAACYRDLGPLLRVSYFDKRPLRPLLPEFPVGLDSTAIYPENTARIERYGKAMILHAAYVLSLSGFREAESILRETLEFLEALGHSNLGLVCSILQSVHARRVSDLLAENLFRIVEPADLRRYADLLNRHKADPECVLNSLRQEYYQLDATIRLSAERTYRQWRRLSESSGFYFPGYTWRKMLDPEDSREILRYLWAKTIVAAAHPPRETDRVSPEFEEMARLSRPWRVMVYKNTIGRSLLGITTPLYRAYGRAARENSRHMESVHAALLLRARYLETGTAGSLSEVTGGLMFRDTFLLRNDTLVSADTLGSKEIFRLAIR